MLKWTRWQNLLLLFQVRVMFLRKIDPLQLVDGPIRDHQTGITHFIMVTTKIIPDYHPFIQLNKYFVKWGLLRKTNRGGGQPETPQRRRSEDSLFADEDIPNKSMPWKNNENKASSALPWDKPASPPNQAPSTPVSHPPGTPASRTPLPWESKSSDTPQVYFFSLL